MSHRQIKCISALAPYTLYQPRGVSALTRDQMHFSTCALQCAPVAGVKGVDFTCSASTRSSKAPSLRARSA
eukprot:2210582-Rhodomonas_salina.1